MAEYAPATFDAVLALLKAATDPDAKKNIEEMRKHSATAAKIAGDADKAARERTAAERTLAETRRVSSETQREVDAKKVVLDKLEKELEARKNAISEREAAFVATSRQTDRALKERELAVTTAESTIRERDSKSKQMAADIAAEQDAWRLKARRLVAETAA